MRLTQAHEVATRIRKAIGEAVLAGATKEEVIVGIVMVLNGSDLALGTIRDVVGDVGPKIGDAVRAIAGVLERMKG